MLACTCSSSYAGSIGTRFIVQGKTDKILSEKELKLKRAGVVAQVVEHLPSKCEALSSNSSTAQKINKISIYK
jgi:hypothetical protein